MTPLERIARLRALSKAATPGQWAWEWEDKSVLALYGPRRDETHVLWAQVCSACAERGWRCTAPSDEDSSLIAESRNALDALLDVAEAAQKFRESNTPYPGRLYDKLEAALDRLAAGEE